MGRIPDGVITFVNSAIVEVTTKSLSAERLWRFAQALGNLDRDTVTPEQVEQVIESEAPELTGLRSVLPKTRNELYAFIGLLILVIQAILGGGLFGGAEELSPSDVERIAEQVIQQSATTSTSQPPIAPPQAP